MTLLGRIVAGMARGTVIHGNETTILNHDEKDFVGEFINKVK